MFASIPQRLRQATSSSRSRLFNHLSNAFSKSRAQATYSLKEGDKINGFEVTRIEKVNDFNITAYHLNHIETAAKFIHLDTNDTNNCLAIVFRTTPHDDKGTPHILEHLTCCGSENYPVRDPFFKMIKRSLNTYMNAWTGPDFTCYPFSSQNEKDFRNLIEVYMANTFSPLLRKNDYLQEGWRYDFDKESGNLVYKGVVFNEMKGVYQASDNIFAEAPARHTFVNSSYNHNYGGDPASITDLSYQEIKEFYAKFYHPTNTKFFSYGDLDFTKTLEFIQNNYLVNHKRLENFDTSVKPSTRITTPKNIYLTGPPDPVAIDPENQVKMSISFLCNDLIQNQIEGSALSLLSYLLCDTATSPLYKALLESGVAPSYSPANGFEMHYKEGLFNLGVSGISKNNVEEVEKIIFDTLREVQKEGFDPEMVEGALHQIEIREKIPKDNFGISLVQTLMTQLIHDGDINQALNVTENIRVLRQKILNEKYLEELIEKFLLSNSHRVRIVMEPDEEFHAKLSVQEKAKLESVSKKLTAAQKEEITAQNASLNAEQSNKSEDYSCLPTLEVSDIERGVHASEFTTTTYKKVPIMYTKQKTNGLTYLRIQFDLERVPLAIRHYLDLFNTLFTRIGTKQNKHDLFHQKMNLYTTNFSFDFHSSNPVDSNDSDKGPKNYAVLSVACIDRNIPNMFELLQELLTTPDFNDMTNVSTILRNTSNELSNSIIDQSMTYAFSVAAASLRENFYMKERLRNTRFLCNYANNFTKSKNSLYLDDLCFHLQMVIDFMVKQNKLKFVVHGGAENEKEVISNITRMIDNFGFAYPGFTTKSEPVVFDDEEYPNPFQKKYINKFFKLPMQVNYCIQSVEMPHYTHPDTPALNVLAELIGSSFLHTEIREKGGAYGSGCQLKDGVMNFYSYRDPNTLSTIEAYARGVRAISEGNFNEENLKESKLSLFSKFDKIVNPQDKGLAFAFEGISDETRRLYRTGLIDADRENIIRVAREHLLKKVESGQFSKVIFGNELNNLKELESHGYQIEEPVPGFNNSGSEN